MTRIGPGSVLELHEQDYLYGTGTLTIRVDALGADPTSFRNLEWVRIVGREVRWDGSGGARDVMVRVAAVPRSLRPTDWRPERFPRG